MSVTDDFGSVAVSSVIVKGWTFGKDNSIDLEVWDDDRYLNTLTIDLASGKVIYSAK